MNKIFDLSDTQNARADWAYGSVKKRVQNNGKYTDITDLKAGF